jgi:putative transposase
MVRALNATLQKRGAPKSLFCDSGRIGVYSQSIDLWAYRNGVQIDFSRPGKPTDNAYVESFNGTLRAECLDMRALVRDLDGNQAAHRGLETRIQ